MELKSLLASANASVDEARSSAQSAEQELKEKEESYRQKHGTICVKLEPNHSHIIAVEEDGASKFGVEREIRAEFEACAGHNRSKFEFKIGDELPKPERMSESALGEKCRKKIALTS